MAKRLDLVEMMGRWEQGGLETWEEIELFQQLVDTGLAWTLQGAYGRQAQRMIDEGWIDNGAGADTP